MHIQIAGENSLIVYFHQANSIIANSLVSSLVQSLDANSPEWLLDITPAYDSVLVVFDCLLTDYVQVKQYLKGLDSTLVGITNMPTRRVVVPVLYNPPGINDLARISEKIGLTREEIIHAHHSTVYRVFAIGFAPGFAFLGDVDPRIAMPRLSNPRKMVPKGAVGIADQQTAVYPNQSPGGWNIIGLSPFEFFKSDEPDYMPLQVGDEVMFKAVSQDEYIELGGSLER